MGGGIFENLVGTEKKISWSHLIIEKFPPKIKRIRIAKKTVGTYLSQPFHVQYFRRA
jgi:hypothetical protein